jgi:hypothetical protein
MTREEFAILMGDLAKAGVDAGLLNNLGRQVVTNTSALNVIDKNLISSQAFNQYKGQLNKQIQKAIDTRFGTLAVLKDQLASLKKDSPEYKQAITDIKDMEDKLIQERYDANEVRSLTLKTREGLSILGKLAEIDIPNVQDIVNDIDLNQNNNTNMGNNNNQNNNQNFDPNQFLRHDDPRLNQTMAEMALGSVGMNAEILDIAFQYENLYGQKPTNMTDFIKVANQNFREQGKKFSDSAEEFFKFGEKRQEIAQTQLQGQLEAAEKRGESNAIKKYGIVPNRVEQGSGAKRHLTNIVSRGPESALHQNGNTDLQNADNQLNQNRQNEDSQNQNNQIKFNRKEFTLPPPIGEDGLVPAERRGGGIENRHNRVRAAMDYVEQKNIDLTAD